MAAIGAGSADAAALFAFEESGGDVVGTLSGSLDLTDAAFAGDVFVGSGITPGFGVVAVQGSVDRYEITAGPTRFGGSGNPNGISGGGAFYLYSGVQAATRVIGVPGGYSSGEDLDSTLAFEGATFASLNVTPGTYVFSLPNDTLTLRFGPAATTPVPLPAGLPLLVGGLGLLAMLRRR